MSQFLLTLLNGEQIPYQLERRPRKTVGLRISAQGLVVHAPKRISQLQLEGLLISKSEWIQKKLIDRSNNMIQPILWENGTELSLLGTAIELEVISSDRKRKPRLMNRKLIVALPQPIDSTSLANQVIKWFRNYAINDFNRRVEILSTRLGEDKPRVLLSSAKARWGSCNSKREIRINWRLIQAQPHIINYVICHELAHLREMNHSARFWQIVEDLCPEYKEAENCLKSISPKLHAIDIN